MILSDLQELFGRLPVSGCCHRDGRITPRQGDQGDSAWSVALKMKGNDGNQVFWAGTQLRPDQQFGSRCGAASTPWLPLAHPKENPMAAEKNYGKSKRKGKKKFADRAQSAGLCKAGRAEAKAVSASRCTDRAHG